MVIKFRFLRQRRLVQRVIGLMHDMDGINSFNQFMKSNSVTATALGSRYINVSW
jgi:hypothetical protein